MVFDTLRDRMGGKDHLTPMEIASHTLFTAREKIDLLNRLKAEATGASDKSDPAAFEPEEIDEALAHVHQGVADGVGSETVFKGDY